MSYFPTPRGQAAMAESTPVVIASNQSPVAVNQDLESPTYNMSGRLRTSNDFMIFEGKTIDSIKSLIWDQYGLNGGVSYANNTINLYTTSGSGTGYSIIQSRISIPYLSAQTNWAEFSVVGFSTEANVTKRLGMYRSNAVAPYQSNFDGFYLENDGTTLKFITSNNGTITNTIPVTSWDNYALISSYDFANVTGFRLNYIWNDSVELYMFINEQWQVVHTIVNAGVSTTLAWSNPYLYARCAVVGNDVNTVAGLTVLHVGAGCENLLDNQTRMYAFNTGLFGFTPPTLTTLASGQIAFALMKLQKTTSATACIQLVDFDVIVTSADGCIITLMIDPNVTEVGATVLSNQGAPEITVTAFTGISPVTSLKPSYPRYVWSRNYNSNSNASLSNPEQSKSFFSFLQNALNEVGAPLYICAIPLTANQVIYASANVRII